MPRTILRTSALLALAYSAIAPVLAAPHTDAHPAAKGTVPRDSRLLTFDTCTRILEGDLIETKKVGLVRLVGVIAPTKGETGYQEALDATRKLALGKQVKLEICQQRPNDYRDRVRAVVYLPDGTNLNTKLLRVGTVRLLDRKPCHLDVSAWGIYETSAQKAKLGLWGFDKATARRGEEKFNAGRKEEETFRKTEGKYNAGRKEEEPFRKAPTTKTKRTESQKKRGSVTIRPQQ